MTDFPHNFKAGTDVYSLDGHKLGELRRVVIKRSDLTMTDVVVDIGFLRSGRSLLEGGLGLDYDRIVPIGSVASSTDERVELTLTAEEFKALPEYTDESFEGVVDPSTNEFDVNDVVLRGEVLTDAITSTPGAWVMTRLNKPVTSVDIAEGTDVWRMEPHQKIGDVKRIIMDEHSGSLKAVVVSRGFILKHDVVIPTRYIAELEDDIIRLDISDAELHMLRPYMGEDEV